MERYLELSKGKKFKSKAFKKLKLSQVVLSRTHPDSCPCSHDLRSALLCDSLSSDLLGQTTGNHLTHGVVHTLDPSLSSKQSLATSPGIWGRIRLCSYSRIVFNDP